MLHFDAKGSRLFPFPLFQDILDSDTFLTSAWEIFEKLEEQVAQAPILICRAVNLKGSDEYNKRKFEPLKEIYSTYVESLARLLRFACLLVLFMFFSD